MILKKFKMYRSLTHKIRDDIRDRKRSSKYNDNRRCQSIDGHKEWCLQKSVLKRCKDNIILINKCKEPC